MHSLIIINTVAKTTAEHLHHIKGHGNENVALFGEEFVIFLTEEDLKSVQT